MIAKSPSRTYPGWSVVFGVRSCSIGRLSRVAFPPQSSFLVPTRPPMVLRRGQDGRTFLANRIPFSGAPTSMPRHLTSCHPSLFARHGAALAALAAVLFILPATPAAARGPENIADVAEQVIDAVVNISTSQKVDSKVSGLPDLPPGSPMEEFFDEFFKNRRGGQGGQGGGGDSDHAPHRINSLGSGFIIDPTGLVVTNNHVIADADEIN